MEKLTTNLILSSDYISEGLINVIKTQYVSFKRWVSSKAAANGEELKNYASYDGYYEDLVEDAKLADTKEKVNKLMFIIETLINKLTEDLENINNDLADPAVPRLTKSRFNLYLTNTKTFLLNLRTLSNKLALKRANFAKELTDDELGNDEKVNSTKDRKDASNEFKDSAKKDGKTAVQKVRSET